LMSTWTLVPQNDFMPKARAAALRAIEIDDSLGEAHASLALIAENYDYNWPVAEKEFRRAIELDPEYATTHQWYAENLSWQGRFGEALAESERARQLDPLSLIIATDHGAILYFARQYDHADKHLHAVLEMDPNFSRARQLVAMVDVEEGKFAEAVEEVEHQPNPDDSPMTWPLKAYVYGRWGRTVEAQQALARVEEAVRHSPADATPPLLIAYLGLGHKDQAIALLQKAYLAHSNAVVGIKVAPYYDALRGDPRFQDLLRRTGFAQ
jgi:tetratricopeptide (TPR) repeat protein